MVLAAEIGFFQDKKYIFPLWPIYQSSYNNNDTRVVYSTSSINNIKTKRQNQFYNIYISSNLLDNSIQTKARLITKIT